MPGSSKTIRMAFCVCVCVCLRSNREENELQIWKRSMSERKRKLLLASYGEGNGNPLQYSCLENPRDGGAWWAAVYGVTQSRTRLKRLSSSSSSFISLCKTDDSKDIYSFIILSSSPAWPLTTCRAGVGAHSQETEQPSISLSEMSDQERQILHVIP